jgi:hypothetical protein
MIEKYDHNNITVEDIRLALHTCGFWLPNNAWDGCDPVKAFEPNLTGTGSWHGVEISLCSVINWLNINSGYYDPT